MIEIIRMTPAQLEEYSRISIAFEITSVLKIAYKNGGLGGIEISEESVVAPYAKNYDVFEPPTAWREQWNLENWGIFVATHTKNGIVGGIAVAHNTPGLTMLEGRSDIAVVWDIRVVPSYRGQRIGNKLFQKAVEFSVERGCNELKIETQNTNVPACRFYEKQGCTLGGIRFGMYKEFPDEVQLLWYKKLG